MSERPAGQPSWDQYIGDLSGKRYLKAEDLVEGEPIRRVVEAFDWVEFETLKPVAFFEKDALVLNKTNLAFLRDEKFNSESIIGVSLILERVMAEYEDKPTPAIRIKNASAMHP